MTRHRASVPDRLARLADAVLLPCFDGLTAPEWVRRRVAESLGGVCLFARNIESLDQVAEMTASLATERDSVVIAIDEEAGDVTRIDAATGSRFPGAAALGQVDDVALTAQIAEQVGQLLSTAGISLNLAPCADVAINPANPVIGSRSFGADPALVARHTAAWVTGQQAAGVAACAKHFPGHGDTDADTHRSIAIVHGDMASIRREALPPFAAAIDAGAAAIMPGHLLVPAVDAVPATVSARWLIEILREEMGFTGVIVTDALEMAAVAAKYGIPGGAVRALAAGADLLCIGGETRPEEEINAIRDAIVDAVLDGSLPEARLVDAATRSSTVGLAAARTAAAHARPATIDQYPAIATAVAAQAIDSVGTLAPLSDRVLVVRCTATPNIAVGAIPWGPATMLEPTPAEIVLIEGDALALDQVRAAGSVIVVTRDRHRHPWMVDTVGRIRDIRPDAVLVEMGITPVDAGDSPAIVSFGATMANTRAVVDLLTGAPVTA